MAIFISDQLLNGGLVIRSNHQGFGSITTRITIPNGTPLASGDILKFARVAGNIVLKDAILKTDDLDTGTTIAGTIGTVRAVVDPAKAFNATTNPYLAGAATADAAAGLGAAATIQGTMRTGGVIAGAAGPVVADGVADVALTLTASPTGNPTADRIIELTFDFGGLTPANGAFSGGNAYDYTNDTADLD